jgi:hypothetical protein
MSYELHTDRPPGKNLRRIFRKEAELQRDTTELAKRFFAQRPHKFGLLLKAWVEDWQHANSSSVAEALIAT